LERSIENKIKEFDAKDKGSTTPIIIKQFNPIGQDTLLVSKLNSLKKHQNSNGSKKALEILKGCSPRAPRDISQTKMIDTSSSMIQTPRTPAETECNSL